MRCKFLFPLVLLAAGGCAMDSAPPPALPAPGQAVMPLAPAPPLSNSPTETTPVYRPPKIARIYLRAHVDTNGRLVGPQVIYQIIEAGGWNLEAVDHAAAKPEPVIDPSASSFLAQ
ncbi:MAG TPA: TraV family lipoprotein [Opitutaceae bacterium]|jgi:hypothetical protein